MSFRDDREAAHRRADALEQELKRTKEELEAMRSPRREGRHGGKVVAAVVMLGALGAGVYTTQRSVERRREQAQAEAERSHAEQAEQAERAVRVALEAARAAEARAEAERAREAASLSPTTPTAPAAAIVWRGSVDQAVGVALAPGAPCTIEGAFAPTGGGVVARSLTIACGGQQIYRAGPEAASASASLREGPVHGSGAHEYMLRYSDEASPTRATASTLGHTVSVWREGEGAMRVTMFVRDVSEAREGEALGGRGVARQPSFAGAIEAAARVTSASGHSPAAAGARCVFAVRPVWEFPENCRVALRCGSTWIYGARESGYLTCEVQGGRPLAALDENTTNNGGDPRVRWRGRRVVVSDFTEAGEWSMELAL